MIHITSPYGVWFASLTRVSLLRKTSVCSTSFRFCASLCPECSNRIDVITEWIATGLAASIQGILC